MNKLIYIFNKIFYILSQIITWIRNHWNSLRKIFVISLIIGGLIYQLFLPVVRKKINNYTVTTILQHEQKAISLKKSGKRSEAIDSYKNAITVIISQKKISYVDIDDNIKYRIYKNTALLILDYSRSNTLTDSQKNLLPILSNELSTYQKKIDPDISVNKILSDIILLQK